MKAFVFYQYGSPDVLHYEEVEKPAISADQLLIKVYAVSINPLDWHDVRGAPFLVRLSSGLFRPKERMLGVDFAGRVESVGSNITSFQPGDEVFGSRSGAFAEYVAVSERRIVAKPANLSFEQAAAVPVAAITALQALRDHGEIQAGHKVLVNGASGGVGTFAVQIAKSFGADVSAVCSTRNVEMVRSLGADQVIDYTQADFTRNGQSYDLIIDNAASRSFSEVQHALAPQGKCIVVGYSPSLMTQVLLRSAWTARRTGKKIALFLAKITQQDLLFLQGLLAAGKVTPIIDKTYPFYQLPEALRYLEEGHAKGKVVVTVGGDNKS